MKFIRDSLYPASSRFGASLAPETVHANGARRGTTNAWHGRARSASLLRKELFMALSLYDSIVTLAQNTRGPSRAFSQPGLANQVLIAGIRQNKN